jgi:carbon monoxide dehydrogenase subunit G
MKTASRSAEIDAPAETVFAFLVDPANLPRWMGGIVSAQPLTDGPVRVGSMARVVRELLGQRITADVRLTAIEPGRHVSLTTSASGMRVDATLDVEPLGERRSRVTFGMQVEAENMFMKAVEPMVAQAAEGDVGASLERLQTELAGE